MACIKCDLPTPREKAQIWTTPGDASHSRKKTIPYPVHTLSKMQGTSSKTPKGAPQIAWVKQQPHSDLAETVDNGHRHPGKGIYHKSALTPISSPPREAPKKTVKDELIPIQTKLEFITLEDTHNYVLNRGTAFMEHCSFPLLTNNIPQMINSLSPFL